MIVTLYTGESDSVDRTLDLPDDMAQFLIVMEQRWGELSHAGVMLANDSPDKQRLNEFWRKLNADEYPEAENTIPRICTYR